MDWTTYKSGVTTKVLDAKSEIDGTETLVTTYTGKVPESVGDQVATLQHIHFYDHTEFIRKVEEIGFKVLYHELGPAKGPKTFLECLLQRAPRK